MDYPKWTNHNIFIHCMFVSSKKYSVIFMIWADKEKAQLAKHNVNSINLGNLKAHNTQ